MNKDVQLWFEDPVFKAAPSVEKERAIGRFFDETFNDQLQQYPEDQRPSIRENFIQDNLAPHRPAAPSRGILGDVGVTLARGVAGAGELGARALASVEQLQGYSGEGPRRAAQDIAGWRDDTLPQSAEAQADTVRGVVTRGAESAVTSLAAAVPAVAIGAATGGVGGAAAGYVLGAPLFGLAQYDTALEKYTKKGVGKEDAHNAALLEAAAETGGEMFTNLLEAMTVGAGGMLSKPLKEAAKNGVRRVIGSTWGMAGKKAATVAGLETVGELATAGAQGETEYQYGVGKERFLEAAKSQFGEIAVAGLIFGALGGGLHKARTGHVKKALTDTETPMEVRLGAVQEVAGELERVDPELARRWRDGAAIAVLQGKPISDEIKDEPPPARTAATDAPLGAVGENVTEAARADAVATITGKGKKGKDIAAGKPLPQEGQEQGQVESPSPETALGDVRSERALPEGVPAGVRQFTPGMAAPAPGRMVESQSAVEQRMAARPVTAEEVAEVAPPAAPNGVESLTGRPVESIAAGKPLPQENIAAGTPLPQDGAQEQPTGKKPTLRERALAEFDGFVGGLTPEQRQAVGLDDQMIAEMRKSPATGQRALQVELAKLPAPPVPGRERVQLTAPTAPAPELLAKEDWEQTPDEYIEVQEYGSVGLLFQPRTKLARRHRTIVEDAIRAGKPVPAEVMRYYPDLQKKPTAPEAPGTAIEAPGVEAVAGEATDGLGGGEAAVGVKTITGKPKAAKGSWFIDADDNPVFFGGAATVEQTSGYRGPYTEKEIKSLVGYEAVDAAKARGKEKPEDIAAGKPLPQEEAPPVEETVEPAEAVAPENDETVNPPEEESAAPAAETAAPGEARSERTSPELGEIQVEIRAYSETGAAMTMKERADVALKENGEQTDMVRRILDCLNT
jgi:hypothetical protein